MVNFSRLISSQTNIASFRRFSFVGELVVEEALLISQHGLRQYSFALYLVERIILLHNRLTRFYYVYFIVGCKFLNLN